MRQTINVRLYIEGFVSSFPIVFCAGFPNVLWGGVGGGPRESFILWQIIWIFGFILRHGP